MRHHLFKQLPKVQSASQSVKVAARPAHNFAMPLYRLSGGAVGVQLMVVLG